MNPAFARRLIIPLHERACRRPTLRRLRELEQSQWLGSDELRRMQRDKLRRLLAHALERTVFYRSRLGDSGLDATCANRFEMDELPLLPTLTKDDIRANLARMTDPAVRGGLIPYTTGGSSGQPLQFFIDRARQAADQAARARSRRWFGIELGEREMYLWGSPVELSTQDRIKVLRDRLLNHRLLSAFNMTPRTMSRHLDEIRRFDPAHIFGYPSSIARLVRHAREIGRPFANPSLRAVFMTGELLSPADRATIEEAVPCPVADGYGAREAGFIAHQCPAGSYHVAMEGVIVEILDPHGRPLPSGETGEITITNLDAMGMPLIRYRTGDMAAARPAPCSCGRGLSCLELVAGRKTDMLRTTDGGHAHALSVLYVLREQPGIREYQVVQQADLSLDVRLITARPLEARERDQIALQLAARIGPGAHVRIQIVEKIDAEASGKHRSVMSFAS